MNLGIFVFVAASLSLAGAALAETADGSGALALAALVGENSPLLGAADKATLAKFLDGQTDAAYPAGQTIAVTADKLTCRASNVEIAAHSCELAFGAKSVTLSGRRAHELYATLAEIGVAPDGAAGSIFEAVSGLKCAIDPSEVKEKAGRRGALRLFPAELAGNRRCRPRDFAIATPLLPAYLFG
ncbi:hypothetical protein [Methyloceanibacter sp.]|uniref:hypothetical protein n=1 Tax=Methyloceanibacter sp. TaxID=1965321 RepID=UPI002D2898A8|nr:hypothetical protein [Methyloceanibacter sp.]HZP08792.1 hypothetical protein [Methyloceanibacter sp.]